MPTTTPRPYEPLRKMRVICHGLSLAMRDKAVAYKVVLAAELLNTAIEELCDYVQPERAPQIGATKDIAAAAVSVCMGAWVIVMLIEGWRLLLARES